MPVMKTKKKFAKPITTMCCPICWRPDCHVFLVAHARSVTKKERRNDGGTDGAGAKDAERSDFLRKWHPSGAEICDVCKRNVVTCRSSKFRHARSLEALEAEAEDARQYAAGGFRKILEKARGEEKERLKVEMQGMNARYARLLRKIDHRKKHQPCKLPVNKATPAWWKPNGSEEAST